MENTDKIAFNEYVYYDETSPTCLRWKIDRNKTTLKDSQAGYISRIKSRVTGGNLTICGDKYDVHRVVWNLHNGNIPEHGILFYADKDKSNLKISNLVLKVYPPKPAKIRVEKEPSKAAVYGVKPMRLFSGIKTRCGYNPSGNAKRYLHYKDSYIYQDWLDNPESFYDFIVTVDNYNSVDDKGRPFHIEKDLFGFNSDKTGYYPETICFLPNDINQMLQLEHPNQRKVNKGLPLGVTKDGNRYKAQLSSGGKPVYLGSGSIEDCKELYKKAKVSRLEELIEIWKPVLPEKVIKQLQLFVSHLKAF